MLTLLQSPTPALRYIEVVETDEAIELSGTVRSFYHKQLAQTAVLPQSGGREIINRIRVAKPMRLGS